MRNNKKHKWYLNASVKSKMVLGRENLAIVGFPPHITSTSFRGPMQRAIFVPSGEKNRRFPEDISCKSGGFAKRKKKDKMRGKGSWKERSEDISKTFVKCQISDGEVNGSYQSALYRK